VLFKPASTEKCLSVRQATGEHIGHLVTVKAMVTRITDVRPDLSVATYTCGSCGSEVFQEVVYIRNYINILN
jgi:DNA replication licensing factor MCM7